MGRTLEELGRAMPLEEFLDHYEDYCARPWDGNGVTVGEAMLAATIMNWAGRRAADGKVFSTSECDPHADQHPPAPQDEAVTTDEALAFLSKHG